MYSREIQTWLHSFSAIHCMKSSTGKLFFLIFLLLLACGHGLTSPGRIFYVLQALDLFTNKLFSFEQINHIKSLTWRQNMISHNYLLLYFYFLELLSWALFCRCGPLKTSNVFIRLQPIEDKPHSILTEIFEFVPYILNTLKNILLQYINAENQVQNWCDFGAPSCDKSKTPAKFSCE